MINEVWAKLNDTDRAKLLEGVKVKVDDVTYVFKSGKVVNDQGQDMSFSNPNIQSVELPGGTVHEASVGLTSKSTIEHK